MGDVVQVDGTVEEYRGACQLRVRKIVKCAPEEYDLRVSFTRQEGTGPVAVLLAGRGRSFGLALDVKGEARLEQDR